MGGGEGKIGEESGKQQPKRIFKKKSEKEEEEEKKERRQTGRRSTRGYRSSGAVAMSPWRRS